MDPIAAARGLRKLHLWIEDHSPHAPFSAASSTERVCDAVIVVDSTSDGEFPSNNRNRISFMGVEQPVKEKDLDAILSRFTAAHVKRLFFWLSVSEQADEIEAWVQARGMKRWTSTGYPSLGRPAARLPMPATNLQIRMVSRDEAVALTPELSGIYGIEPAKLMFLHTLGAAGHDHLVAFDGPQPVAAAILTCCDNNGLLWYAGTAKSHRNRGAQNALIAARIDAAARKGCKFVFSETLYMLETSLNNLKRHGFDEIFEKKVYACDLHDRA